VVDSGYYATLMLLALRAMPAALVVMLKARAMVVTYALAKHPALVGCQRDSTRADET